MYILGVGTTLTDPQIMTKPDLGSSLFGDGKVTFFGRAGPLDLPDFGDGAFGSSFGIGSSGAERDLAF